MKPIEIFKQWDLENLRYCHWKSNEHLLAGMNGETDLDVLVAGRDIEKIRSILHEGCCLRVQSLPKIPGVEDWVCFDNETTQQYHLHLHTFIPLGGTKTKIFEFNITDMILDSRVREDDVWVVNPAQERSLLALRILLKIQLRQIVRVLLLGGVPYPENIKKEIEWLSNRNIENNVPFCLPESIKRIIDQVWESLSSGAPSLLFLIRSLLAVRIRLIKTIVFYRLFISKRKRRKRFANGGCVIAIVGVDGSGKSSIVDAVTEWLSWKISVEKAYLGLPKKTILGTFLRKFISRIPGGVKFFYLYAGVYRVMQGRRAKTLASEGNVVLTDRYPLPILWNGDGPSIDGPRISSGSLSRLERFLYTFIKKPNTLIYLRAPIEVLKERDSTLSHKVRTDKFNTMERLVDEPNTIVIDATQTFDEVLTDVKRSVWKILCQL